MDKYLLYSIHMVERIKLILDGMLHTGDLPNGLILSSVQEKDREATARYMAIGALCESGTPGPCGSCNHCSRAEKGVHPDFYFHRFDCAIKIDDIREIRTTIQYGPSDSTNMMIVIHNAHNMTASAQNALLKSLEEPPKGVHFILTTDNAMQLLGTIRSRSFMLDIPTASANRTIPTDHLPVAYTPLMDFLNQPDSSKLQYAQNLAVDKESVRTVLLHWLHDASSTERINSIGSTRLELIISTLSNMQYNSNTRLQLESLVLQL